MWPLLGYVPKNHLSWAMGRLAEVRLPSPVNRWCVELYAKLVGADLNEAEKSAGEYRSLAEFFVRNLKPGVRLLPPDAGSSVLSPVDGFLRAAGFIKEGFLTQVKGRDYSLADFLGDEELAQQFRNGSYFNLYLSPRDYHHVHSPVSGTLEKRIHIPGKLWPVNDWSIANIEGLFSINERVVLAIRSDMGTVLVVMVGATNVGKITLAHDSLVTNSAGARTRSSKTFEEPVKVTCGDRLGTFHLGSSVVMLFEPGRIGKIEAEERTAVKYGQRLAGKKP